MPFLTINGTAMNRSSSLDAMDAIIDRLLTDNGSSREYINLFLSDGRTEGMLVSFSDGRELAYTRKKAGDRAALFHDLSKKIHAISTNVNEVVADIEFDAPLVCSTRIDVNVPSSWSRLGEETLFNIYNCNYGTILSVGSKLVHNDTIPSFGECPGIRKYSLSFSATPLCQLVDVESLGKILDINKRYEDAYSFVGVVGEYYGGNIAWNKDISELFCNFMTEVSDAMDLELNIRSSEHYDSSEDKIS